MNTNNLPQEPKSELETDALEEQQSTKPQKAKCAQNSANGNELLDANSAEVTSDQDIFPFGANVCLEQEFAPDEIFNTASQVVEVLSQIKCKLPTSSLETLELMPEGLYVCTAEPRGMYAVATPEVRLDILSGEERTFIRNQVLTAPVNTSHCCGVGLPNGTYVARGKFVGFAAVITAYYQISKNFFVVSYVFKAHGRFCLGSDRMTASGCELFPGMPVLIEPCTDKKGERCVAVVGAKDLLTQIPELEALNKREQAIGLADANHGRWQYELLGLGVVSSLGLYASGVLNNTDINLLKNIAWFLGVGFPILAVAMSFGVTLHMIKISRQLMSDLNSKKPNQAIEDDDVMQVINRRFWTKGRAIAVVFMVPALVTGTMSTLVSMGH